MDLTEIDRTVFYLINQKLANPFLDLLMPFVTKNPPLLLLPPIIYLGIRDYRRALKILPVLLLALGVSDILVYLIKTWIARPRPFVLLETVRLLVGRGESFAMPSGHASNTASVTVALLLYFKGMTREGFLRKTVFYAYGIYLLIVVLMVSISRLYVGVHWPSDILAGVLLGTAVGSGVFLLFRYGEILLRRRHYFRIMLLGLIGLSLFRVFYILKGPLELSPDEAHYWDWSRHLQLSYYSKGPAIAYIIRLSREFLGDTELGVRLPAVVFSLLSSLILYRLTKELGIRMGYDPERASLAGILSGVLLQVIPLFSTYAIVNTIDSPLILLWSVGLWVFTKTIRERVHLGWWSLLGGVVGLGLLTKYTMAFFYLSALGYILFSRGGLRRILLTPMPWVGVLISLMVFSPVIIWNAEHNWVTLRHTAGHAHLADGLVLRPDRLAEFIGSQLGVITPVLLVIAIYSLIKLRDSDEGRLLIWFSVPILAFFLLKSVQGKVQANWPLPGYIASLPAMGLYIVQKWQTSGRSFRYIILAGFMISLMVVIVGLYTPAFGIPPHLDPSARLRGWKTLAERVDDLRSKMRQRYFILSDNYQVTAELAFYLDGNPRVYCINLGRRMNQYDLWEGFHHLKGYSAIFVKKGQEGVPLKLKSHFNSCDEEVFYVYEKGRVLRSFSIGVCHGFKGMERRLPERY